MKNNQTIIEGLDYLPGCLNCQVSWDYDCHCQQLKRKAKEILSKALKAKDADHKREMMKLTWPLRYKIGETT